MKSPPCSAVCVALALGAPAAPAQDDRARRPIVSVERIWDRAQHNAFTDLIEFAGRLYCTFREGSGHVPGLDGTVRVLASEDGHNWRSVALLDEERADLRDPKLSTTPDGRIMVVMAASFYRGRTLLGREPRVAFSDRAGARFSAPRPIEIDAAIRGDTDWLWRVTWRDGVGYGVLYQPSSEGWGHHLLSTRDGVRYRHVTSFPTGGRPNETTLRFLAEGTMVALVRREGGNRSGLVGTSAPPYREWSWTEIGARLGGPNFVVLANGRLLAATRVYGEPTRTGLAWLTTGGGFEPILTLPSGGDTSYPGLLVRGDRLLVSYYASHEGRTSIYLATLRLDALLAE